MDVLIKTVLDYARYLGERGLTPVENTPAEIKTTYGLTQSGSVWGAIGQGESKK